MKKIKLLSAVGLLSLAGVALAGCGGGESQTCEPGETTVTPVKVNVGVHQNYGSAIGVLAETQGYYAEEKVEANIQVTTGPNVILGLQTGTLDIGFLGNGVAWNYFTEDSGIKLVAIDNLTNDDRLIAKDTGKGAGLTEESSNEELRNALKGAKVALDLGATPGTFFKNLVSTLNQGLPDSEAIWFKDSSNNANFPELSTYTAANEVLVVQTTTANITATMSSNDAPDFCVAFAPIWGNLLDMGGFTTVATTEGRNLTVTPSNWAVRTDWIEQNPDAYQRTMNALVKAMDYRSKNAEASVTAVANYIRVEADTLMSTLDATYFPTVQEQYDWTINGRNLGYVESIRDSHFGQGHDPVKTSSEVVEFSALLKACASFLKVA